MTKRPAKRSRFPVLANIDGLRMAAGAAGVKYTGRKDLMLAVFDKPAAVAGVFTKSKTASAPVQWDRYAVRGGLARALVVNSGNANAFTGVAGKRAVHQTAEVAAKVIDCPIRQVFVSSTGVIGEYLNVDPITEALPKLHKRLKDSAWRDVAQAIMTTDTFPKGASCVTSINGKKVRISGIAKGSGMIAPNMATMLAFIFTDADIPSIFLKALLRRTVPSTFNSITVDGDMSTNDMVGIFSTGEAKNSKIYNVLDPKLRDFENALQRLMLNLAKQIVADGEGAKKFVKVTVSYARSFSSAKKIAFSIANSPLVKTAIAGEDPNWGRIIMAIGKSEEDIVLNKLKIKIGEFVVVENGKRSKDYDEKKIKEYMQWDSVDITVELNMGDASQSVYTCDFTKEYIDINADYRN